MRIENRKKPRDIKIAKAVQKELEKFPANKRDPFLGDIERLSWGLDPVLKVKPLSSAGKGIMELIINGSPAYRVVYTLQFDGQLVVLAARTKTCEGQDDTLIDVVKRRRKDYE